MDIDTSMKILQQIKRLSKAIRNDSEDSGNAYVMGYLWACLSAEEKIEAFNAFNKEFIEMIKK